MYGQCERSRAATPFVELPGAPARLFCFPHAGGDARLYATWPALLPGVEVWGIQYPGHGSRLSEPPLTDLAGLVQELAEEMLACLDRPFLFFGHSMGALVSFELARLLRDRHGLLPERLIVSGCRGPQVPDPNPAIHWLPDLAFLDQLRRYNGTPQAVLECPELMQILLPPLRADFRICETYQHQPGEPFDVPIVACGGIDDPLVAPAALAAWQQQSTYPLQRHLFRGDHFYLVAQKQALLGIVRANLAGMFPQRRHG